MASITHIVRRRHRRQERRRVVRGQQRTWSLVFGVLFGLLVVVPAGTAFGSAAVIYANSVAGMPAPREALASGESLMATTFYDRTGTTLLHTLQDPLAAGRPWVTLDTLPPYVIDATLLAEDPDFLVNTSFDLPDTLVKLWATILIAPPAPDSSISGRLVRNAIAPAPEWHRTTIDAHLREIALIAELNRRYAPREILEWHLNTNDYGSDAYGIEAAAQLYLGKRAVDLTLDEAALLTAIPTAPQYNPFDNEMAARARQVDLLRAMVNAGVLTPDAYDRATAAQTLLYVGGDSQEALAPELVDYARAQAEDILDALGRDGTRLVTRGGLRITTTVDLDLQTQADCTLRAHLARMSGSSIASVTTVSGEPCVAAAYLPALTGAAGDAPPQQGTLIMLNVRTGEITSMVGSAAAQTYQPGPTMLPFVYFKALLDPLYNPARMVLDIPTPFPGAEEGLIYLINNPDGRFRGPMSLREAMGAGLLAPAADVAYRQGMSNVIRTAHELGLNSLDESEHDLLLLEGGGSVSPLDVTYAYSVFASLGSMRGVFTEPVGRGFRGRDPVAVLRIEDADGALLWQFDAERAESCSTLDFCTPRTEPGPAYLVNDILADQSTRWTTLGEGNPLELSRPGAVVNGVTSDRVDNWTVGYTPQYALGVHLMRADRSVQSLDAYGIDGAAPVWRALMEYVHLRDGLPPTDWTRPAQVVDVTVCERSGLRPTGTCPVRNEVFLDGTQQLPPDRHWQAVEINTQTGQRATANTPAALRAERLYFVPPDEAMDWWTANNQPLPPTELDTVSQPEIFNTVSINSPGAFDYIGGVVDILGVMDADEMQYFQVSYGQGISPTNWIALGGQQTRYTPGAPLAAWDTNGLDGLYSLSLVAVMNDNSRESATIQVTVDNQPPTVSLNSLEPGRIYRWPGDEVVTLQAQVSDNLAIDRVEFYHNGQYLGADESEPYGFEWRIEGTATEAFSAVAFDAVGNQANAQLTVEILRAGS